MQPVGRVGRARHPVLDRHEIAARAAGEGVLRGQEVADAAPEAPQDGGEVEECGEVGFGGADTNGFADARNDRDFLQDRRGFLVESVEVADGLFHDLM